MKLKELMLKNFGAVSEVSVNFSDSLTYFIGNNGSGKTTIGLHGVWFILQGLAAKSIAGSEVLHGERYRFIGPGGKSAKGSLEIYDEKAKVTHTITRKLLKDKAPLEITSSDGIERGQEFLDSLFSSILIDPRRFFKLSPKAQALAFGVDTSKFDDRRKILEAARLEITREKKRLKGVVESAGEVEKVEEVPITSLLEKLNKRQEQNVANQRKREELSREETHIKNQKGQIARLEEQAEMLNGQIKDLHASLTKTTKEHDKFRKAVDALEDANEQEIRNQLSGAEETNAKARKYAEVIDNQKAYDAEKVRYGAKDDEISILDAKRTKYIKAQKLPYNNITISDEGEFRLAGKPFQEPYFSTGEALKFGALLGSKIAEKQGDKLDYVWISGCQDLDENNRGKLFESLAKAGLQVAAEYVDTKKQKKAYSILLKEMKVVKTYDDKKAGTELA